MGFFASVNGEISAAADARVSVLDNGFLFGDGVYETLRTYGGRPFHLDRHLARLRSSAGMLGVPVPMDDRALARDVDRVLERAQNPESTIRLLVTRGVGDATYRFDRVKGPTVVILAKPFEAFPESLFTDGIPVIVASVRRNHPRALDPAMKSNNLINNILATREAQGKGAFEPILLNELGEVAEGAGSNVFIVRGGALLTPPLEAGILPGVTRAVLLEIAPGLGIPAREEPIAVKDLLGADEAFITSTLKEALPIATVDGRPIGGGRPGPLSRQVLQGLRAYAAKHSN
ncbi:MAG TPA: aminotransferase class IV [Vicinamibacteria bacterium]|nr:aminotransferase class IV [Vicinamibacteria bacterium]